MKNLIILFIIIYLFVVIETKQKKCLRKCDCPKTIVPVCSNSGKTFENACVANCFSETIKHVGKCEENCGPKSENKHRCVWRPIGTYGRRKHCCNYIETCSKEKGCKKLHKKCYWKGAIITKIKREKCLWTNRGKNRKQVRCCVWFKKMYWKTL